MNKISGDEICAKTKITVRWPNGTSECFPCVTCPRGWGATYSCGDVVNAPLQTPIKCVKCKRRETFSTGRSSEACKKCIPCHPNHQIIKKCTRSADTKCGGCKRGYYKFRDPHFSSCEKCSPCCGDAKDERIGECANQGLARHLRCSPRQDRNCDPDLPKSLRTAPSSKTSTSNTTVKSQANFNKHTTSPAKLQVTEHQKAKVSQGTAKPAAAANHQTITINNTNTGLIIGVVLGIVAAVLVIMLVFLIFWCIKRQRNKNSATRNPTQPRVNADDVEMQPLNNRTEQENESEQVPSRPLKEFMKDPDELSEYEECCRRLNTTKHPDKKEHFYKMSRAFDIDSDVAEKLLNDDRGAAQALFEYLDAVTAKEITLEQIARVLDRLPGRAPVAKMLREADDRLKQKSGAQQQGA